MIGWNALDDIFRHCRTGTEGAVDALDKARAERDSLLAGRPPRPAAPLDRRRRVGTCQRADRRWPGRPDESRRTRPRLARAAPAHLVVVLGRAGPMPGSRIGQRRSLNSLDALTSATIELLSTIPCCPERGSFARPSPGTTPPASPPPKPTTACCSPRTSDSPVSAVFAATSAWPFPTTTEFGSTPDPSRRSRRSEPRRALHPWRTKRTSVPSPHDSIDVWHP